MKQRKIAFAINISKNCLFAFREVENRLPLHKGVFFMSIYNLSFFLTSTAFASTDAYGEMFCYRKT